MNMILGYLYLREPHFTIFYSVRKDLFGSQPPLELLRQWIDYGCWYDRQKQTLRPPLVVTRILRISDKAVKPNNTRQCVQNLVPLVNIKIAGKWMFIPLKMVLIGINPYPHDLSLGLTSAAS